jgi:hypothetical protein
LTGLAGGGGGTSGPRISRGVVPSSFSSPRSLTRNWDNAKKKEKKKKKKETSCKGENNFENIFTARQGKKDKTKQDKHKTGQDKEKKNRTRQPQDVDNKGKTK